MRRAGAPTARSSASRLDELDTAAADHRKLEERARRGGAAPDGGTVTRAARELGGRRSIPPARESCACLCGRVRRTCQGGPVGGDGSGTPPNGASVFLRDRVAGTTELVSVNISGKPIRGDNGTNWHASISADGRVVASVTLDAVYVRDLGTETTERVDVSPSGEAGDDMPWDEAPALSANGRVVAFTSMAMNLVRRDTNYVADVFVCDRAKATAERVSASSDGRQVGAGGHGPAISADGRLVVFSSDQGRADAEPASRVVTRARSEDAKHLGWSGSGLYVKNDQPRGAGRFPAEAVTLMTS